ncbi:MAG: ABC transporter permease [Prevotella sp.]|nr:ABC transporter permease [Prevotella sp.]
MKLLRNIFSRGQGTAIKVVSLAIGLTVALVLIAKVELERNYNPCIVDKEHVYEVSEGFERSGQGYSEYDATPGGVIPAMCHYIPEIETGTRYTMFNSHEQLTTADGRHYGFGKTLFADSCFFDIFHTDIVQGDAKGMLSTSGQCLISQRLNEKMGGQMVGKTFCFMAAPGKAVTIGGIFRDYEENGSFYDLDIIMSMPTIGTFSYDGTSNLLGNDRYHSFVRLHADSDMKKVEAETDVMLREQLPWEDLRKAGFEQVTFRLHPVNESRMKDVQVKTTCTILAVVAVVMLFTAVMNYILVVISSLVGRARLVAIRKVLGAPRREFYLTTLAEAVVLLLLALLLMSLLLWLGQDLIRQLLGVGVGTLFSAQTIVVLTVVCLIVVVGCGLLPGYIYSRIPTTYAYRLFSENRRIWKLSLLAFQFVLSTMLISILSTIYRQYDYMLGKDMGYEYQDVAYIEIVNPSDSTFVLAREIEKLPGVTSTATCNSLPMQSQSGNNVMLPGDPRHLFNYACLYFVEPTILQTLGLTVVQGKGFTPLDHPGWLPEALVDEAFARKLQETTHCSDVVGMTMLSTEFGDEVPLTITGVVRNFTIGTMVDREERPAMMVNGNIYASYIMIRFQQLTPEAITAVGQLCDRMYPDASLNVKAYATELADSYQETQHTRDLIMIGCLASLLITLTGLIGYIRDEVQRRTRELAIRKVMGASTAEVQLLFLRSIAVIALPSIIVGVMLGWHFSSLLLQQFADKVALPWCIHVAVAIAVGIVITIVAYLQTRQLANSNPVNYLKNE